MVATGGVQGGERWRLAPCLVALVDESDELFPNRGTGSDGSIGDPAHQDRVSDHNPDDTGDVLAVDITDDKPAGCDVQALMDHLVATRDDRVKYLIHNRVIVNCNDWTRRRYTGENPHTHHIHISVRDTAVNATGMWWPAPPEPEDDMQPFWIKVGTVAKGAFVLPDGRVLDNLTVEERGAIDAVYVNKVANQRQVDVVQNRTNR